MSAALPDPLRHQTKFQTFRWSGSNSFAARTQAAAALRLHLIDSFQRQPGASHLLVCHSHGGNVALQATSQPGDSADWTPLAGILTLATPFLGRRIESGAQYRYFMFVSLLNVLSFSAVFFFCLRKLFPQQPALWLLPALIGVGALLLPGWTAWRSRATIAHTSFLAAGLFLTGVLTVAAFQAPLPQVDFAGWMSPILAVFTAVPCLLALLLASWCRALGVDRGACLHDLSRTGLQLLLLSLVLATPVLAFATLPMRLSQVVMWQQIFLIQAPLISTAFAQRLVAGSWFDARHLSRSADPLFRLPCRLDALRLPSDEAALVIGISQVFRQLGQILFFDIQVSKTDAAGSGYLNFLGNSWRVNVGVWGMYLLLVYVLYVFTKLRLDENEYLILTLFLHALLMLLFFPFWWACSTAFALAVGPDTLFGIPAIQVDCEPLPKCSNSELAHLQIDWAEGEAGGGSLRHAIHERSGARQFTARWIADRHAAWLATSDQT
ncbi:MAG: hypothetical protein JNL62_14150 [Bryobacterales bacterium]|nr:hypothetical protein [Bryobacterales bacterium]